VQCLGDQHVEILSISIQQIVSLLIICVIGINLFGKYVDADTREDDSLLYLSPW
jgi:hypothetical protein